jgi:hypothetical protein
MTTAVALTKADLDQVFDEVNNAKTDVNDKAAALQDAEQKAATVKGLTAAAQHALRDAEATLQLLELAKDEAESKSAEYASVSARLDAVDAELTQANAQTATVEQAREAIANIKNAHQGWVSEARQATTTAFGNSISTVNGLTVSEAQKRNVTDELQRQRDMFHRGLDQLGTPQEQQLDNADRQLEASAPPAARITVLADQKASLVRQRDSSTPKPGKAPDSGAIQHARDGVEAARTAAEEAPEVERDRLAKLRLARENLTAAQDRQTAALVTRGEAERSWIEGIDFVGPGVDGFVTAKAKLVSTPLPSGYSLEWTFDGVPVASDSEENIRFNAKQLATGSYAVAVHLGRGQATQ